MKIDPSEKELIDALEKRDPAGVGVLYDRYALTLFKIICCHISDRQLAEEMLENILSAIVENIQSYRRQDKRLLVWMAGIARNQAAKAQITKARF